MNQLAAKRDQKQLSIRYVSGPRNYESLSFQQVLSNPQPSELTISECQSNTSKRDERQE